MKQKLLLKAMLLLCALVAGSSSVWATTTTYQHVFNAKPSTGSNISLSSVKWDISATNLNGYNSANYAGVQFGTSSKNGSITLTSSSAWGTETGDYKDKTVITEVRLWLNRGGSSVTPSVTIGGKSATSDGTTVAKNSSAGDDWKKTTKVTFTPASDGKTGVVVIDVSSVNAGYICAMEIDCEESTGPTTYSVTYNGNGATSGTVPTDATAYSSGATVTVKDNTGSLAKTGYVFGGWNTQADGQGTNYTAGNTFSITASTTLYAKWNFTVTDGIFDFVEAAKAGEDYGSGVALSSDPYTTEEKTWTAINVTMKTSGKYRWWSADKTLRFYETSYMEFSVPDGYVITKIDHVGGTLSNPTVGSMSGSSWVGASQTVKLQAASNFKSVTVTYGTTVSVSIGATGWATYSAGVALDFANASPDGLSAYMVTGTSGSAITKSAAVDNVPANTGLLLNGAAGDYTIPVLASSSTDVSGNKMKACVAATTVKYNDNSSLNYVLANNGGTAEFQKIVSGTYGSVNISAGKAYLALTADPGAPALSINFGDETGINAVNGSELKVNGEYYNLAGQRVANPTKGLYIVNGKKVIVK